MLSKNKWYLFLFVLLPSIGIHATNRTWTGATSSTWSVSTNWNPNGTPGAADVLTFAGTSNVACNITSTSSVAGIVVSGYTGTITQSGFLTVGTSGFTMSSGTFAGGSLGITMTGSVSINGGTFTSTSGTMTLKNNFTFSSGTFNHNSGTVLVAPAATSTLTGSVTFNNLKFSSGDENSITVTIASGTTLTCNGTLTIEAVSNFTTLNTGTIDAKGNITLSGGGSESGGSATININGTGAQTLTGNGNSLGVSLPKININKSSGTLTLSSVIASSNDWTWTAGTISSTGSTVAFNEIATITGSHTLNNVTFYKSITLGSSTALTLAGNLNVAGTSAYTIGTGTINIAGDINVTDTASLNTYSVTPSVININGAGTQVFTHNGVNQGMALGDITINKSAGTLTLASGKKIRTAGSWKHTAGTVTTTSTTVIFTGASPTITPGSLALNDVIFNPTSSSTVTIASGTTFSVSGTLTYGGTAGLTINTGTINPTGAVSITNTVTSGGGSATILFNGSASQTVTGLSSAGAPLSSVLINKTGGTLTFTNTIAVAGNWTWSAGTLATTGSTVVFVGTTPTIAGTHTLANVTIAPTAATTLTIASGNSLTTSGTLTFAGSAALTINTGTLIALSHITITNTVTTGGGSGTLQISGSSNQTLTGQTTPGLPLCNIYFNKTNRTLTIVDHIVVQGNWTYAPTFGGLSTTGSTLHFIGTNPTIDGNFTLNNVTFAPTSASTVTLAAGKVLTVAGTLTYGGSSALTVNTGSINPTGNITVTNTVTTGGGSATIHITGGNSQTFTGLSSAGLPLSDIVINKSGSTLTFTNTIAAGGNWTWTAGTLATTGSTIYFPKSSTIAGTHTLTGVTFAPTAASTITVSNPLTVDGTLTYGGTEALTVNTGTIHALGNISVTNTNTSGGGSTLLNITGTGTQTLASTSTEATVPAPLGEVTISKTGGALTLSNNINAGGNWTYSATSTTLTPGSSRVFFTKTSPTITGSHTLNHVTFKPAASSTVTIASGNTLTSSGTLSFEGNSAMIINIGTLSATGSSISITNTSTGSAFGDATMLINGTGTQTISCSTGAPVIPNLVIDKSAGTLIISGSDLAVGGNLTHNSGTLNVSASNKISLYGNASITAMATDTFGLIDIAGGTRTLASNLITRGTLHTLSGKKLDASGTAHNVTVMGDWNNEGTFGSGTGYLQMVGTSAQTLTESSGDTISKLRIDKNSGNVTLGSLVTLTDSLKFIKGNIISTSTNLLVMNKRVGVLGAGASTGFVSGPARKIGNSAFTFPTGKLSNYQPIGISAPSAITDAFTAEYFNTGQTYGTAKDSTIDSLSTCEYWNLDRTVGTSSVYITAGWNANSCDIDSANAIGYWDASASTWKNASGKNYTGNRTQGTVSTLALQPIFGPIIIIKSNCKQFVVEAGDYTERDIYDIGSPFPDIYLGGSPMDNAHPTATQPNQTFTYLWQPTAGLSSTTVEHPIATPSVTTTYTVSVTNLSGCKKTDVVTFVVTRPIAVLKKQVEAGYYIAKARHLAFEYDEDYRDNNSKLTYKIVELSSNTVKMNSATPLAVLHGTNRYLLDLTSTAQFASGYYFLEVVNEKDEHYYLRFYLP